MVRHKRIALFAVSIVGLSLLCLLATWLDSVAWPWVLLAMVVLAVTSGFAGVNYIRTSWQAYVAADLSELRSTTPFPLDKLQNLLADNRRISEGHAVQFALMLSQPADFFDDITESVQPFTRSLGIRGRFALRLRGATGTTAIVPVTTAARGPRDASLKVLDAQGNELPVLSHSESVVHCLTTIRVLLRGCSAAIERNYIAQLEVAVEQTLLLDRPLAAEQVEDLISRLNGIVGNGYDNVKKVISTMLQRLQLRVPVCVEVKLVSSLPSWTTTDGALREFRVLLFTVQRSIFVFQYQGTRRRSWLDLARVAFGIRPSTFGYSLFNAERAANYALELAGPERTYLASQDVFSGSSETPERPTWYLAAEKRRGQRHAQVVARYATSTDSLYYRAQFYERMPGSMAAAALSALSVAAITALGLFSLLYLKPGTILVGTWEYAALVLGFPAAIAIWVGVDVDRSLMQGVLVSRVSTILTIGIAAAAAWVNVSSSPDDLSSILVSHWLPLTLAAFANAGYAAASWLIRARLQSRFVSAD